MARTLIKSTSCFNSVFNTVHSSDKHTIRRLCFRTISRPTEIRLNRIAIGGYLILWALDYVSMYLHSIESSNSEVWLHQPELEVPMHSTHTQFRQPANNLAHRCSTHHPRTIDTTSWSHPGSSLSSVWVSMVKRHASPSGAKHDNINTHPVEAIASIYIICGSGITISSAFQPWWVH